MAKENYLLLFLVMYFQPSCISCADFPEQQSTTNEYYDYNTDIISTTDTTTTNPSHQSLESARKINDHKVEEVKLLTTDNNEGSKNKNAYNTLPNHIYSSAYNNTRDNNNGNITIEFNNEHISSSGNSLKNTQYQIYQNEINNETKPNEHSGHFHENELPGSYKLGKTGLTQVEKVQGIIEHPCKRNCLKGQEPMLCYYKFNVEWYYSMSKACFNCSTTESDCYRQDCITADGIKRPIIVVNRTLPGPSIEVCLGDRIIVDVVNHLMEESTSIHWHGQHQRESPYMDGVPYVTQCPIPPHTTFRYNYVAATPGTHFWHSHSGCQRTDGVVGNMIIRIPRSEDPHSHLYDEDLSDHIINVMDWAHELGIGMFVAHYHSNGSNKPPSMIVNGKGRFFEDSKNLTATPLAVFNVKKGKRYRFRLINAGNQNCPVEVSIDNHTITVINSDGGNIEPTEGGVLVTYAGERWDFILNTNKPVKNYWIRFRGLMDCDERFTKGHQVAILRYEGAPEEEPVEAVSYFGPKKTGLVINAMNVRMDDPNSVSVPEMSAVVNVTHDPTLKEVADHQLYIGYDFYPVDTNHYHKPRLYGFKEVTNSRERVFTPQFNHISMKMPSVPLLSQRDSVSSDMFCDHKSLTNCSNEHCECTNVISIPLGDVVELILIDEGNTYNANHPFHLHGHAFRVIGMDRLGNSTTVNFVRNKDKAGRLWRNLISAPLKDSVTVPDGGYTIIRFHATNPGYWLFHCHLEFHVEVGMALIFKIGEHSQFPPIPQGFPVCGDYLHPRLPFENLQNFNVKDNEVNFGDDYGTKHNKTNKDKIKSNNEESKSSMLSQLWPIKLLTNDASSYSISYEFRKSIILFILTYVLLLL